MRDKVGRLSRATGHVERAHWMPRDTGGEVTSLASYISSRKACTVFASALIWIGVVAGVCAAAGNVVAVYGHVYHEDGISPWLGLEMLTVVNERTGEAVSVRLGAMEAGSYGVAFLDFDQNDAIETGDVLAFSIAGRTLLEPDRHAASEAEVQSGQIRFDLRIEDVPGACCQPSGACEIAYEDDCSGEWQGLDTDCDPNPCPQPPPTGACCFPGGSCTVTTQTGCTGIWQGADTDCDPNPCPQPPPTGACCFPDGSCTVTTQADCAGTWQGPDTDCDPNPCPQPLPVGACCASTGSCAVTTQTGCTGIWQGADTDCDPNPCPQPPPLGACCFRNASCRLLAPGRCATLRGTYMGDGTVCSPSPCSSNNMQESVGACCAVDGRCLMSMLQDCQEAAGVFTGVESCSPDPCGRSPNVRDETWGRVKSRFR